ncbi:hypothetical protein ACJIZ3_023361 [Penstemon smallii]|uniref:Uncharacterized protein n=1 Tax=Penstemon smallii TaxID=265156 RepID=A0ABD3TPX0_9LAMI
MKLTDKEALLAAKLLLHQICLLRHLMLRMCLVLILCSCLCLLDGSLPRGGGGFSLCYWASLFG